MSAFTRFLIAGATAAILAGCGGGGSNGNDNDGFGTPQSGRISFETVGGRTSLPSNRAGIPPELNSPYYVQFNVRVQRANGSPVADGTQVNLRTSNVRSIAISRLDDPSTTDVNEFSQLFGQVNAATSGGLATFFLHSLADTGTAVLTASTQDPELSSRTIGGDFTMTVTEGPAPFKRIQIEPVRTVLPPNLFGVQPFLGSPFIAEMTITRRGVDGRLLGGGDMQASVNPVTSGGFSQLNDPSTTDVDEFTTILGAGPLTFTAGKKTLFFHSFTIPGNATLTITATDPDTGARLSEQQVFTVATQTPDLPADVDIIRPTNALYVQGSGGLNTLPIQAIVENGAGVPIPDPPGPSIVNNVQWEIVDQGANGGELLTAVNGQNQNVEGRLVRVRTQQGAATVTLRSGTRQGTFVIRASADRADNNVDNGLQSPVSEDVSIIISDGKLFSLKIVSPSVNALRANLVSGGVSPIGGSQAIPTNPNGTYSLVISVLATDRQGNPVLPNTPIDFGLIDAPAAGYPGQGAGQFLISGADGDPQEAGNLFTAPSGQFTTAGGGAGPGDTLIVFGEQSNANRDLESARRIERILSASTLNVTQRFNSNNDTGTSVNAGPVLPYVIGKATVANITPNVLTTNIGVATTSMNYPVNQLGRLAAIWARGAGETVNGNQELVTDAELIVFPGAGPAALIASPNTIPANTTATVSVCLTDALGAPLRGAAIGFRVTRPSTTTTVDGQPGSGVLNSRIGASGCVEATIVTGGIANANQTPTITFTGGGQEATVNIAPPSIAILQAFPSSFFGGNGGPIQLRLINGNNEPIPGVLITGTCTGGGGAQLQLSVPPGLTDANGRTQATVIAINLDQPEGEGNGQCVFTAAGGSPTTTVNFQGINVCSIFFSPSCG
jgi:hypothetical protein